MTRTDYADALGELARDQHQVATTGQLAAIGVPASAVRNLCRPGGRWQRVLPKVVVLRPGPLTVDQRCRAALAYAGFPAVGALLTGPAALALHGLDQTPFAAAAGGRIVDVLVPRGRAVRTHTWVRMHYAAALPAAQHADGLPVAPLHRAAVDAVRASCDPLWVRSVLTELVRERGVGLETLANALLDEALARKSGVPETLRDLRAQARCPVPPPLRALVRGCGLRPPLWRPVLRFDGAYLGSPDAYWPREGVALGMLDPGPGAGSGTGRGAAPEPGARQHAGSRARAQYERLAGLGLRVVGVPPDALTSRPGRIADALRIALETGPHGPHDRITVFPAGG
ncbi:type IV toxin-antitoxin system AbiEi family antitoxin domain-containing protein [Streptomyces sp. NPDC051976]|uniref:type IV toxin-antitoxin system AbiEi family antitoxin domain-containing protein n=1 Tax=Streptomyces sp. NPDC051976 TaxID=3154947 RepID=UPI0034464B1A